MATAEDIASANPTTTSAGIALDEAQENRSIWAVALLAVLLLLAGGVYTLWSLEHRHARNSEIADTAPPSVAAWDTASTPLSPGESLTRSDRLELEDVTIIIEREHLLVEDAIEAPSAPQGSEVFVHTVVKGDTLWAIAERYLGDPYRYPALAELSHIRDPHWIYPGDKVRIIRKR